MIRFFALKSQHIRRAALSYLATCPDGLEIAFREPRTSLGQNDKFHAAAMKEGAEMVLGIEGEFVNLRESTASMSKARGASLITYAVAFCDLKGVELSNEIKK